MDSEDHTMEKVQEGLAVAMYKKGDVFYNPVQVVNRDLSVLVIREYISQRRKEIREVALKQKSKQSENGAASTDLPEDVESTIAAKTFSCLEGLAASGLRSVRYAKECAGLSPIVANDLEATAVEAIQRNLKSNNVAPGHVIPNQGDANEVARYPWRFVNLPTEIQEPSAGIEPATLQHFDIIDLDPYGSVAPFLAAAIANIQDGGLLCLTSTDKPVLCGKNVGAGFSRYGGIPHRGPATHEAAVRLVLYATQREAMLVGKIAEPVLCVSIDFYVRLFVRIFDNKQKALEAVAHCAQIYTCVQCGTYHIQPLAELNYQPCSEKKKHYSKGKGKGKGSTDSGKDEHEDVQEAELQTAAASTSKLAGQPHIEYARSVLPGAICDICGGQFRLTGPIWTGALIDPKFVHALQERLQGKFPDQDEPKHLNQALNARVKVGSLLQNISEELIDVPLFLDFQSLIGIMKLQSFSIKKFRSALASLGYSSSVSHTLALGIKTKAPWRTIWDILRIHVKRNPPVKPFEEDSLAFKIMGRTPIDPKIESKLDFDFDMSKMQKEQGEEKEFSGPRFPQNPANWGPKKSARMTGGKRKVEEL